MMKSILNQNLKKKILKKIKREGGVVGGYFINDFLKFFFCTFLRPYMFIVRSEWGSEILGTEGMTEWRQ